MGKTFKLSPAVWGSIILVIAQALTYYVAFLEKRYIEYYNIVSPELDVQYPLLYFFGVVVVMCLILFFIPVRYLKVVFRILFALLFGWGLFITLVFILPIWIAIAIGVVCGLAWLIRPYIWLHNLLLIFSLVSVGAVFGFLITPWVTIALMAVLSVYDVLAVRFGLMIWMAKMMSNSEALPAFILPRGRRGWTMNLKGENFQQIFQTEAGERDFAILGGGDVGFPLLLAVSVFFVYGFTGSLVVALFSLLGLIGAFLIQQHILKGKPLPALPPITFMGVAGFLIVYFLKVPFTP